MHKALIPTLLLLAMPAYAADFYICTADKSTGFIYKDNEWQAANFDVNQNRYLVRKATEDDLHSNVPWLYGEIGQPVLAGECDEPFVTGLLNCRSAGQDFRMNTKTMRSQLYYWIGYVASNDTGVRPIDTPFIEIGRCSPL